MKIFFTASLRGKKEHDYFYEIIYNYIRELGYKNVDDEIFKLSEGEYYNRIEKEGRDAYVDLYQRKIKHIQEADLCIFECTLHSLSIGFLIEKAMSLNKPTIVLYLEDNIPHFLAGVENDKLIVSSYKKENLIQILKNAIEQARDIRDTRFNFFISPSLLSYLEETSKKLSVTKSTFIRNLILADKKKRG